MAGENHDAAMLPRLGAVFDSGCAAVSGQCDIPIWWWLHLGLSKEEGDHRSEANALIITCRPYPTPRVQPMTESAGGREPMEVEAHPGIHGRSGGRERTGSSTPITSSQTTTSVGRRENKRPARSLVRLSCASRSSCRATARDTPRHRVSRKGANQRPASHHTPDSVADIIPRRQPA
jgi:hypothetical protein